MIIGINTKHIELEQEINTYITDGQYLLNSEELFEELINKVIEAVFAGEISLHDVARFNELTKCVMEE